MKKIILIGCPASGKTTLGKRISKKYKIPILYLDKIFWVKPQGIKQEDFLKQQNEFMESNESWVIDGNFHRSISFESRVTNADYILIFDLPKILVYWRFLKRLIKNINKQRHDMPEERKESFKTIWGLIKYIWNFNTEDIIKRIEEFNVTKKVIIINSKAKEKEIYKTM